MKGDKAEKNSSFTSQILGIVLKIILLYFFVPVTIFLLSCCLCFFFLSIDLLALIIIGVNEVTRLKFAGNATYTSQMARDSMLEATYSGV